MLLEINYPFEYIMDLFVKDILRDDNAVRKYNTEKEKNIIMTYRGLLFLLERRFETFMNVILFKRIIQYNSVENLVENIILCLRAGMVLTITNLKVWKALVRDNFATSFENFLISNTSEKPMFCE